MSQLLVIGCGFHRQFTGKEDNVLNSWKILLKKIAGKAGLNVPIDDTHPTHTWERLVLERVQISNSNNRASKAEKELRGIARCIIHEASEEFMAKEDHDEFKELLKGFKGHILNLNFDRIADEWIGAAKRGVIQTKHIPKHGCCTKSQARNLFQRWIVCNSRESDPAGFVWHPHGTINDGQTLRLGLRDYGLQPAAYKEAFDCFKQWQRRMLRSNRGRGGENQPITDQEHEELVAEIEEIDNATLKNQKKLKPYDNWVTRFMLLDVTIIGAGISDAEIGIHWLLAQRARNFARIRPEKRPFTRYFYVDPNLPVGFFDYNVSPAWDIAWRNALG